MEIHGANIELVMELAKECSIEPIRLQGKDYVKLHKIGNPMPASFEQTTWEEAYRVFKDHKCGVTVYEAPKVPGGHFLKVQKLGYMREDLKAASEKKGAKLEFGKPLEVPKTPKVPRTPKAPKEPAPTPSE